MSARFAWFAGGSLFVTAVALVAVGLWLPAALAIAGCMYVCGRWDRVRDRQAVRAEVERLQAEVAGLTDELITHHNQRHIASFGDPSRMLPDLDDRPDWVSLDRKPDTTPARDASPSRAATNP